MSIYHCSSVCKLFYSSIYVYSIFEYALFQCSVCTCLENTDDLNEYLTRKQCMNFICMYTCCTGHREFTNIQALNVEDCDRHMNHMAINTENEQVQPSAAFL